jgi:hypothetical protein
MKLNRHYWEQLRADNSTHLAQMPGISMFLQNYTTSIGQTDDYYKALEILLIAKFIDSSDGSQIVAGLRWIDPVSADNPYVKTAEELNDILDAHPVQKDREALQFQLMTLRNPGGYHSPSDMLSAPIMQSGIILKWNDIYQQAALKQLAYTLGKVGPCLYFHNGHLVVPVEFDYDKGIAKTDEALSSTATLQVTLGTIKGVHVDVDTSGAVQLQHDDGVTAAERMVERLVTKVEPFHFWRKGATTASVKLANLNAAFYGDSGEMAGPNSYRNKCKIVVHPMDSNLRCASAYDLTGNFEHHLIVHSSQAALYNALDPNQLMYAYLDTSADKWTVVISSLAGHELSSGLSWNTRDLRDTARRLSTNRRNVKAVYSWNVDKDLYEVPTRTTAMNMSSYTGDFGKDIPVELVVLNQRSSQRLAQMASGAGVHGLSTKSLKAVYADRINGHNRLAYNDMIYEENRVMYQGQEVSGVITSVRKTYNASDSGDIVEVNLPMAACSVLGYSASNAEISKLTYDLVMSSIEAHIPNVYKEQSGHKLSEFPAEQAKILALTGWKDASWQHQVHGMVLHLGDVKLRFTTYQVGSPLIVNGVKIRNDDFKEVVRYAFMCNTQSDFDDYLTQVSKMSVAFRNIVARGLQFKNVGMDGGILFEFEPTKDGKSIQLVSDYGTFHCGGASWFTKKQDRGLGPLALPTLLDRVCRPKKRKTHKPNRGADGKVIALRRKPSKKKLEARVVRFSDRMMGLHNMLYQEAAERYRTTKTILASSIVRAVKLTAAVPAVCTPLNQSAINGYRIKGGLDDYLLSTESDSYASVFRYKTGEYICMVDKAEYIYPEQKLVSRLYVLANDKRLSTDIDTL